MFWKTKIKSKYKIWVEKRTRLQFRKKNFNINIL